MVQPLWKTVWRFLKKLKIELPYDPAIPPLDIYLKGIELPSCKDIHTHTVKGYNSLIPLFSVSSTGDKFPGDSDGKASACNAGDQGSIPGLERSPGEGNGNPLQYSCLENPMDGAAWWAVVHGVAKELDRTE